VEDGNRTTSEFNLFVADHIGSFGLQTMLRATVIIVNSRCGEATQTTIVELTNRVFEATGVAVHPVRFAILFTAIVRYVFDESYLSGGSLLEEFGQENEEFGRACERLAAETCERLELSQGLLPATTRRRNIAVVFGQPKCRD
jgi:hypothetical protein